MVNLSSETASDMMKCNNEIAVVVVLGGGGIVLVDVGGDNLQCGIPLYYDVDMLHSSQVPSTIVVQISIIANYRVTCLVSELAG
ncbi:unnamed protein product [Trichobilharzia regenti]|nr:unnamed protein product [Trichobilharzia regenti]